MSCEAIWALVDEVHCGCAYYTTFIGAAYLPTLARTISNSRFPLAVWRLETPRDV
jgi:hypothetical protein